MIPLVTGTLFGTTLEVGDLAPDFDVTDTDGKQRHLSEMLKGGPVVLAFFPKAFTPGCTSEMQSYRDRFPELEKIKGQVLAISTDDLERQRQFKAELKAPFAFIADPEGELVQLYGVKTPLVTFARRRTFVIDGDRRIRAIFSGNEAVNPAGAISACSVKQKS